MFLAALPLWIVAIIVSFFALYAANEAYASSKAGKGGECALALLIFVAALGVDSLVIAAAVYVGRL